MATLNVYPAQKGPQAAAIDAELRSYLLRVYNYMAAGLALTGTVAYMGAVSGLFVAIASTPFFWLILLAPLVVVLLLSFRIERMSLGAAQLAFWTYAALVGLSLSSIFLVYTGQSIAQVFFITAGVFGAMSIFGYTTHADLSRFGSFLFMGLIGIIIASFTNFFFRSSQLQFIISTIGVIVFVGLTAYDTQRIKQIYVSGEGEAVAGKKAIMGALALYLDFLNLFLLMMQLFGGRRR
jgi:FtsH-binding integral membrane protein